MIQSLLNMDSSVLLWVQQTFVNDALTPVMAMFTRMGNNGMIWIAIAGLLSLNKKTRKIGILCFVALAFAVLVDNVILKNIVARARPYDVISQVQLLIERQNDYSFPSGHAASSFAVADRTVFDVPQSLWNRESCPGGIDWIFADLPRRPLSS